MDLGAFARAWQRSMRQDRVERGWRRLGWRWIGGEGDSVALAEEEKQEEKERRLEEENSQEEEEKAMEERDRREVGRKREESLRVGAVCWC